MSNKYEFTIGYGDTITCDDCNDITENWFSGECRAICEDCYELLAKKGKVSA